MATVSEDYVGDSLVAANCRVDTDVCESCKSTVHGELGASHVEGTDRRMMADLLVIDGDSLYVGLKCLA